jgi:hypothetical protein
MLFFYRFYAAYWANTLTREALERFGDFKTGQVIRTVKYTDDVLLAKEETVLQDMLID